MSTIAHKKFKHLKDQNIWDLRSEGSYLCSLRVTFLFFFLKSSDGTNHTAPVSQGNGENQTILLKHVMQLKGAITLFWLFCCCYCLNIPITRPSLSLGSFNHWSHKISADILPVLLMMPPPPVCQSPSHTGVHGSTHCNRCGWTSIDSSGITSSLKGTPVFHECNNMSIRFFLAAS